MENKIENNTSEYNCILRKIKHKPIIVEHIFSFIKDEPYKFLYLIEKDTTLKNSLNSTFNLVIKGNTFSKELNYNIQLIKMYKKIQKFCRNQKIFNYSPYEFETYVIENTIDPSFIIYKSKEIFRLLIQNNKSYKSKINPSNSSLIDIVFHENDNEHFNLVYLPPNKNKYKDGFIKQRINEIKQIDTLYCIIDDNQYYNDNLYIINKDIIINNIFFIYLKSIKEIDIYKAIEKYLNLLNKNKIKKITFGDSFFNEIDSNYGKYERIPIIKMINDAILTKKKFTFPINFNLSNFKGNIAKLYLGFFILFGNQKIEGLEVIENLDLKEKDFEKLEKSKNDVILIKITNIFDISNDKNINKIINLDFNHIIFYLYKKTEQNKYKKNNKNYINFKPNLLCNKNFLIYSEFLSEKIEIQYNSKFSVELIDSKDNLIMFEYNGKNYDSKYEENLISYLFLFKKLSNSDLCFKFYFNIDNFMFKIYFVKKNKNYNVFLVYKDHKEDIIKSNYNYILNFKEFINYCKNELNLKIDKIKYVSLPFEWNDALKDKNKIFYNNDGKTKTKNNQKIFAGKMNQKKMLEYELNEDDYYEENEEYEEDIYSDDY